MINGVLVERTVKDVTPALKTNAEGLKQVLEELVKQYKKQQDEMEKWKVGVRNHRGLVMTLIIVLLGRRRIRSRSYNSNRDSKPCIERTVCRPQSRPYHVDGNGYLG